MDKLQLEAWLAGHLGVKTSFLKDSLAVESAVSFYLEQRGMAMSILNINAGGKDYFTDKDKTLFVTLRGHGQRFEKSCRLVGRFSN